MDSPARVSVSREGRVAVVTVDRQEVLNALDPPALADLIQAFRELGQDDAVRAAVLAGAGRAFMAGADVRAMSGMSASEFRRFAGEIQELTRVLRGSRVPVIAAIGGPAAGAGCEIACACDLRIASAEATFSFPEVRIGLVVTSGASHLLPRIVGRGWARRLLLTGEAISAEVAHRVGLVDEVVEPSGLLEAAVGMAGRIAAAEPLAVTLSRRLLDGGEEGSLEIAMRHEVEAILSCLTEGAAREGFAAFLEKRQPGYSLEGQG